MKLTIEETNRRREKQIAYNSKHGLVPTPLNKKKDNVLAKSLNPYAIKESMIMAAKNEIDYSNPKELDKAIKNTKKQMENAAQDLDFLEAVKLRDKLTELKMLRK